VNSLTAVPITARASSSRPRQAETKTGPYAGAGVPIAGGRSLEFGRDLLVGTDGRLRQVPGPAVGIEIGIGRRRQDDMDPAAIVRWRRPVYRGADERMAEDDPPADLEQPGRLGRDDGVPGEPEPGGSAPHQGSVAGWLGRREQHHEPRRLRQLLHPSQEALLDPAGQRELMRQAEAARQLGGRAPARQFEQRQRVPPGFGQYPLPDLLIERPWHDRAQQRPGIEIAQSPDHEAGDSVEILARLAGREGQQHALGLDPAGGEGQRLRRGLVQPLAVVHHADQRPLRGRLRQQAQDGQADQEAIGGRPFDQAEGRPERIRLR
jgi:hypothetical protein